MFRLVGWAITSFFRSRSALIAENLCLRHQLLVLQRRHPRPRLRNADRRFWILACRWLTGWRRSLVIVRPETVLGWHRKGWKAYWRWRSRAMGGHGRRTIGSELRSLIRRMAIWPGWGSQSRLARSPKRHSGSDASARRTASRLLDSCMKEQISILRPTLSLRRARSVHGRLISAWLPSAKRAGIPGQSKRITPPVAPVFI